MPYEVSRFVNFVQSMEGMSYWYGTYLNPCSDKLLTRKSGQYPIHYTSSRMSKYHNDIHLRKVCTDCIGLLKGFFWTNGGEGVLDYIHGGKEYINDYGTNGCPDKSADQMLSWVKSKGCEWGKMSTLPEVAGILLFTTGHVGVYIGNGYAIEARGFNYGVVKTKVNSRSWTTWAYLPSSLIDYTEKAEIVEPMVIQTETTVTRTLRITSPRMTGNDVKALQTALNALGYDCGEVDGVFGTKTEKAVRAFQTDNRLEVDGQFGKKSAEALRTAQSKPEESTEHIYTVGANDTLWAIASRVYGDGNKYTEIMKANGMSNTIIWGGMKLALP